MRVRSVLAAVAAASLSAGLLTAAPASAAGTGLEGTVLDDAGAPVSTCVSAYDVEGSYVDSTCTDEAGRWALPGLADGGYRLEVSGTDTLVGEWFDDATDLDSATPVDAPGVADTVLATGARVGGTFTDADGAPAPWVDVQVTDPQGDVLPGGSTSTDQDGTWSTLVPPGPVVVHFTSWPVEQWAHQKTSLEDADVLDAVAGATTTVDDSLIRVPKITGTVTDPTGKPLPGICASLLDEAAYEAGNDYGNGCTDADGRYEITPWGATTGGLTVFFRDSTERPVYAPEFAGGAYRVDRAATVPTGTDQVVDAQLAKGGVFTGRVATRAGDTSIKGVCPSVWRDRSARLFYGYGARCSTKDGTYRVTALPPGSFTVRFDPDRSSSFVEQWYRDASTQRSAELVAVKLGRTTTLRTQRFVEGGQVSGVVTDPAGRPVAGAWVYVGGRNPGRAGPGEGRFNARTDARGRYTATAPAGTTTPLVMPPGDADLAPQWSGGARTSATATPVTVRTRQTVRLDFHLVPGATIAGEVVLGPGTPAASTYVAGQVFTGSGDYIGDFDAGSFNDHRISARQLPAGRLVIRADVLDESTGTSREVWFDGATSRADATRIPTRSGATTTIRWALP
ncbi:carboxypeptidase-like regulatory domain-containing protein [Arthrobacter sp. NEB 688]|uniref:carboxypeptidase-like regulatory domain-containing protein n=1 Tax=Arthrobacter sp. NEB 688 TaxID=904039 RepID=UPI0015643232|nr:carboxypeptidase-like regulatory domain-containing protein [Arthrobacter sp. NEB 688]QKE85041.1 carboxypeptidase regulatory-like domain-containing protein [Arthrobacter sp. NEB 688]